MLMGQWTENEDGKRKWGLKSTVYANVYWRYIHAIAHNRATRWENGVKSETQLQCRSVQRLLRWTNGNNRFFFSPRNTQTSNKVRALHTHTHTHTHTHCWFRVRGWCLDFQMVKKQDPVCWEHVYIYNPMAAGKEKKFWANSVAIPVKTNLTSWTVWHGSS